MTAAAIRALGIRIFLTITGFTLVLPARKSLVTLKQFFYQGLTVP